MHLEVPDRFMWLRTEPPGARQIRFLAVGVIERNIHGRSRDALGREIRTIPRLRINQSRLLCFVLSSIIEMGVRWCIYHFVMRFDTTNKGIIIRTTTQKVIIYLIASIANGFTKKPTLSILPCVSRVSRPQNASVASRYMSPIQSTHLKV